MNLQEAWDSWVSRKQAQREVRKHGLHWDDFVRSMGLRETYRGCEVLEWLGY